MNDDEYWNTNQRTHFDFNFEDSSLLEFPTDVLKIPSLSNCINDVDEYFNSHASEIDSQVTDGPQTCSKADIREFVHNINLEVKPSPQDTISKIVNGKKYNLTHYKSLSEKLKLLDCAVKTHDGNVIIEIILYLKNTLKSSIFVHEIQKSDISMKHYQNYLRMDNKVDELSDMLMMVGNCEDAAITKFAAAVKISDPEKKLNELKKCLETMFRCPSLPHLYIETVKGYINLLEWQFPIQKADMNKKVGVTDLAFFNIEKMNILDLPPITTLYYSCYYHYGLMENLFASPLAVKKALKISDKEFLWVALRTLAHQGKWMDIDNLIIKKNRQERAKVLACLGAASAFSILSEAHAPSQVLQNYLQLVSDCNERLQLIKAYGHHTQVIQMLINMQDCATMKLYMESLVPMSNEYQDALNAFNSLRRKL